MTDYEHTTGYPMTVYRGAQLLDAQMPGWEDKIDVRRLDLAESPDCIVGQLLSSSAQPYDAGLKALGIGGSGAKYGFSVWGRQSWDDLTAWWRELLAERKAARA